MEKQFYYLDGKDQKGPYTVKQLKDIGIKPETMVWSEEMDSWNQAKEVLELKNTFNKSASIDIIEQQTENNIEKSNEIVKTKSKYKGLIIKGFSIILLLGITLPFIINFDNKTESDNSVSNSKTTSNSGTINNSEATNNNEDEVTIGNQIWSTKNLNVSTFRNGDQIPEAQTKEEWEKASDNKKPAWCYFNNSKHKGEVYGKLYNWYAVSDPRGLAPKGWHIPNESEWEILLDIADEDIVANELKSTTGWAYPNSSVYSDNGNNNSGFSALPGGQRCIDNTYFDFYNMYVAGYWWSDAECKGNKENAHYHALFKGTNGKGSHKAEFFYNNYNKGTGCSVRLIKD